MSVRPRNLGKILCGCGGLLLAAVVLAAAQSVSSEASGLVSSSQIGSEEPNAGVPATNPDKDTVDQRLVAIQESLKRIESKEANWIDPKVLGPMVIGLASVLAGFLIAALTALWSRMAQREAHVLESVKWFEKGSQKRSIGISVIEGSWRKLRRLRPTWTSLLVNQAVYLLRESGQEDALHEVQNLDRIRKLLERREFKVGDGHRKALREAIRKRKRGKGLALTKDELDPWNKLVGLPLGSGCFLAYYEAQTEEEAVADDEAGYNDPN